MIPLDKKAIADSFSLAAGTYDGHVPAQKYFATRLFGLISSTVSTPCIRVADLGCGTGFLSEMLRAAFPQAHLACVDFAQGMLKLCKNRLHGPEISYINGDIEQPCYGCGYDLIASNYALQWTDLARALRTAAQSLTPFGLLALALPVAGSFPELAYAYRFACGRDLPGPDYPEEHELSGLLQQQGLELIRQEAEDFRVFFPDARSALRSFKRCGAVFNRHENHTPLRVEEVRTLLANYDLETLRLKQRVGLTFRTLYLIARPLADATSLA